MDTGVQGEEPTLDVLEACNPMRTSCRDFEGEETPEQKLERQKNALLTMISVRELKALLGEMEGTATPVKDEQQPPKRHLQRPIRRNTERLKIGVNTTKRRNAALKAQQQTSQRVTTFCFDRLEIGDFKLTAPDERCAVGPGTNWLKVDADQRIIIYQFIIVRRDIQTPYNVTVHVPFSSISAIFCGFPEIIIKLSQPAIQASCFQSFGNVHHQIVNDLDVTEGQLAVADVHKTVLRRSLGSNLQDVLLASDFTYFSAILSNGNHLSASSSLYSNYIYNNPHGLLSDYAPTPQHSSYLGGIPPMPMNSSLAPHLTYSAPMMNMGAGGVQLEAVREDGEIHLTEMQPVQMYDMGGAPINDGDEDEFREMFENRDIMRGNGQNDEESVNDGMKCLPLQLSPVSSHSTYITPFSNASYSGRPMRSSDGLIDISSSIPRCTSSSLYGLSGCPAYPLSLSPGCSSALLTPSSIPSYSHSHCNSDPSSSPSLVPPSYSVHSQSVMTPSPLLPLSPFFSFSPLTTPTSVSSPAFWNTTMGSPRMEAFDSIASHFHEGRIGDLMDDVQQRGDGHDKVILEHLEMIPKDETKEEPMSPIPPLNDDGLIDNDERAKFNPSEYSFSSFYNFDTH